MKRSRIVFWQPMPSPHLSSFMRNLAAMLPGSEIISVFEKPLKDNRIALGWVDPDFGRIQVVAAPNQAQVNQLALESAAQSMHILSDFGSSMIRHVFAVCAPTNALVGIMSEGRDPRDIRGLLRLCHSLISEHAYRARTDFVLAMGDLGIRWFQRTKYNPDRIFSWGYFVELPVVTSSHTKADHEGIITFAYVGQLIDRKGVDILLRARAQVRRAGWRLQLMGHGNASGALMRLARKVGIEKHIEFLGARPNPEVRQMLAQADALILPSRFDGWGAVVNEALMNGVPVICSDHCGAADLIESSHHGEVVKAGSVESLAAALARTIDRGPLSLTSRERIRKWSDCLEGANVVRYFLEIIRHCEEGGPKPTAPWLVAPEAASP